jgi:hypothetical protein
MMKLIKLSKLILLVCLLMMASVDISFGIPIPVNDNWTFQEVTFSAGVATLSDVNGWSYLYQGVASSQGMQTLSFDYKASINTVSGGSFSDLFSSSIYFGSFNPNDPTTWTNSLTLLDKNAWSLTVYNGTVKDLDDGWSRLTLSFINTANLLFLDFELFDENQILGDGAVSIRNVSLDPVAATVPEPSTLLLLVTGLLSCSTIFIRKKSGIV